MISVWPPTFFRRLNADIKKQGIQGAMQALIEHTGTTLRVKGLDPETREILKNMPVVIVADHPHETEVLALLASMPRRQDLKLVINADFYGVCSEADKYFIPVYIRHNTAEEGKDPFYGRIYKLLRDRRFEKHTPEVEHAKNRENIARAASVLNAGGAVIIYPENRTDTSAWYSGLGYMLAGVTDKKRTYVACVQSAGTSSWDYFRVLPFVSRFMEPIDISFKKPFPLHTVHHKDPKQIVHNIRRNYNSL